MQLDNVGCIFELNEHCVFIIAAKCNFHPNTIGLKTDITKMHTISSTDNNAPVERGPLILKL